MGVPPFMENPISLFTTSAQITNLHRLLPFTNQLCIFPTSRRVSLGRSSTFWPKTSQLGSKLAGIEKLHLGIPLCWGGLQKINVAHGESILYILGFGVAQFGASPFSAPCSQEHVFDSSYVCRCLSFTPFVRVSVAHWLYCTFRCHQQTLLVGKSPILDLDVFPS